MFELLVNAVKMGVSKEVRGSANALLDLLTRSPDWAKEICTVEARIPTNEKEQASLICDLISYKLDALSYRPDSIRAFRMAYRELVVNAFEHGIKQGHNNRVTIVLNVSPTYVATSILNPKGSAVELTKWIKLGAQQLIDTGKMKRGRGLQVVYHASDVLEPVGNQGVKFVIYRDAVELETGSIEGHTILFVVSGHSNPSLGRQLVKHLESILKQGSLKEEIDKQRIIICLDPVEYKKYKGHKNMRDLEFDDEASVFWSPVLTFIDKWKNNTNIIFVKRDKIFKDLLPKGLIHDTMREALTALKSS